MSETKTLLQLPKIWKLFISLEFCIKDFWIGVYWDGSLWSIGFLDVFICLIPFFPIHIFYSKDEW